MYRGLTSKEVAHQKELYGTNRLPEPIRKSLLKIFLETFEDRTLQILVVALVLTLISILVFKVGNLFEAAGIAVAILLASLLSTIQQRNSDNAFEKLKAEENKKLCKVYRDDSLIELPVDDLVVNDVVVLQTGDRIPADGYLMAGEISVDQSSLNGESKEANKIAMPYDTNYTETVELLNQYKVYRGAVVTSGNAVMRVKLIGVSSEYGKIAMHLSEDNDRETPLQVKLSALADKISKFGYVGSIGIFVVLLAKKIIIDNGFDLVRIMEYLHNGQQLFVDVLNVVMLAVTIIIMAVPEGLPLMIAIVISLNVMKMIKDKVLVKNPKGIETAGSVNLICSDKTGTITKGKLEVINIIDGNLKEFKDLSELKTEGELVNYLNILFNSDGQISNGNVIGGNQTEKALLNFINKEKLIDIGNYYFSHFDILDMKPFNSTDKYSAVKLKVVKSEASETDGKFYLVKGAPEKILEHCKYMIVDEGTVEIDKERITNKIDELTSKSMRTLALAFCQFTEETNLDIKNLASMELVLSGIVAIRDDIRPEAVEAINLCHSAGIQVMMITGDRKETAVAISKEAGILNVGDIALTSDELNNMSDKEISDKLDRIKVIARALPTDKLRIIKIAQSKNIVVAMTGDGVNDAPALKQADVGFAMGSGTEVAKEASDIIIMDDNFKSIEKAVLYGRTIYRNIQKFITFQLSINVLAVLISFFAPLLNLESPLTIVQILWVNLIMDSLAAVAFGGEPALERYMKERPKKRNENIVTKDMSYLIGSNAVVGLLLSFVFLLFGSINRIFGDSQTLLTGYFTFFILMAVSNAFKSRNPENPLEAIKDNKNFIYVMTGIVLIQIALTYIGGDVMRCYGLNTIWQWLVILIGVLISFIANTRKV